MLGALSPSRAGDFMTCPLLYRFRTIDRLPEPPSPDAVRGTVVHKVLEDLFDLPAGRAHPRAGRATCWSRWEGLLEAEPELAEMFVGAERRAARTSQTWLALVPEVLDRYFTLEDPRRLEPAERELYVEALLDSRLLLRGFVDRIDVAPDGPIRVVDYKTGRSPGELFEAKALFQMKFYALVIWRTRGVVPAMLQLIYLGNGEMLRYVPDEPTCSPPSARSRRSGRRSAGRGATGDWRPSPSRLCDWCAHQAICPEFGGTPPPLPEPELAAAAVDPAGDLVTPQERTGQPCDR